MNCEERSVDALPTDVFLEGVTVNLPTLAAATAEAIRRAELGRGFLLFTLNLEHLVKVRSIAAFGAIYRRADLVTADGWPIVWLADRHGVNLERTCGADLVEPLCRAATERGLGVYFIGPAPLAQVHAIERLSERINGLHCAGAEAPLIPAGSDPSILADVDVESLAGRLTASGARLCFVALGDPKQGFVADALAARCPTVGFICVGAALDFIGGSARRAPSWVQRAGLEWLWRLMQEPRRLGPRYAVCAWLFCNLVVKTAARRIANRSMPPRSEPEHASVQRLGARVGRAVKRIPEPVHSPADRAASVAQPRLSRTAGTDV